MQLAPIAYFAFRRPHHTQRTLKSLASNTLAKDSRLVIFIDGPAKSDDEPLIAQVDAIARSERWCGSVDVVRRTENKGCAASTIEVISELSERYGRVISIEDDNLLSPHFLDFVNHGLERYQYEERVMEVTGYRYPVLNIQPRSGFLASSIGWGWGTWQRAWRHFNPDGQDLYRNITGSSSTKSRFSLGGGSKFLDILRAQIDGRVGGWDIRWAASIVVAGGLAFYPARSLSANIGYDGSGSNCPVGNHYSVSLATEPVEDFPDNIEEDLVFRQKLKGFFKKEQGSLLRRSARRIWRSLSRSHSAIP